MQWADQLRDVNFKHQRYNAYCNRYAQVTVQQANLRINSKVAEVMGIPEEKVFNTIQKYGNTTSGTIPLCLWDWQDKLNKGDNIILAAFGGGFTWGAVLLRW